jgi:prophage antirepressor-like protein
VLNAEKSAGGFDIPCTLGAEEPRRYPFRKRLFYVTTPGIAPLAGRVGEPQGSLVPNVRYINPIRSATPFDIGMAVTKPHVRSSAMTNPASGTSVPSVFQFESKQLRALDLDGEIWFVASDVASALEYRNAPDLTRILDNEERGTQIMRTSSGEQEMITINESGLYSAILRSRKPEAKRFKKWVTAEVLPAIRKTGRYEAPSKSSDIRTHHSIARLDIEPHADRSFNARATNINQHTAAGLLRAMAHATVEILNTTEI